jgi:hypothetical protein
VDTLICKLQEAVKAKNVPVDIKNWMNFTTFDITGDLMFGESFDCLKDSQLHPWIQLIFSSIKALAFIGAAQQFPILKVMLAALIPSEVTRKGKEHFELGSKKVDRRLQSDISRPDFMSAILQNGLSEVKGQYLNGEKIMSRAEIHSNAFMYVAIPSASDNTMCSSLTQYPVSSSLAAKRPQPCCPGASSTCVHIHSPCANSWQRFDPLSTRTLTSASAALQV